MRRHDWTVLSLIAVSALPGLGITAMLTARSLAEPSGKVWVVVDTEGREETKTLHYKHDAKIITGKTLLEARPLTLSFGEVGVVRIERTVKKPGIEFEYQPTIRFKRHPQAFGDAIRIMPPGGL